jgi:beta-glucosidase
MKSLGLEGYRFSISWPRIQPTGRGPANTRGLDFYRELVEGMLERRIRPLATLYHWDLPQALENQGGWPNRSTADAFAAYADAMTRRLGDRVRHWITLNEPWCSAFLGYHTGEHAPGKRDPRLALQASHTLLLGHGKAVEALRANVPNASIGITLNPTVIEAGSDQPADRAAAWRFDGYLNRWFLDPLYGRGYPADMLEHYGSLFEPPSTEDPRTIAAPIDFLGVNYYNPHVVVDDPSDRFLKAKMLRPLQAEVTEMGWAVRPSTLQDLLRRLANDYPVGRMAITENGAAYRDQRSNGRVPDPERTQFLERHLEAAAAAIDDGVPLAAYFAWSLLDNFEWAWGFSARFGIVYVDFATQRRIVKDSGHWYRGFIRGQRAGGGVGS